MKEEVRSSGPSETWRIELVTELKADPHEGSSQ